MTLTSTASSQCGGSGVGGERSRPHHASRRRYRIAFPILLLGLTCIGLNERFVPYVVAEDEDDKSKMSPYEILLKLYGETRGLRWKNNTNWLKTPNFCDWAGVQCYESDETDKRRIGHVKKLDFTDFKLLGTVPQDIYDLPYIYSLVFRDNPDMDVKFDNIAEAQYLEHLTISNTAVKTLDGVDQASALTMLHLTECQLQGPFPSEIYNLKKLRGLFANFAGFTGTLSTKIGQLTDMKELYLFKNDLQGQIPSEIGLLTDLKTLALAQNAFSGTMPHELNQLDRLEILAIQREKGNEKGKGINGTLPSLRKLYRITEVYFENQRLSGGIPDNFLESAPKAQSVKVDLSGNNLGGKLPESLADFSRMKILLADNEIAEIPAELCSLQQWMDGDVGDTSPGGCDAILCPKGYFKDGLGRASASGACDLCDSGTLFMGSTTCDTTDVEAEERRILIQFYDEMDGKFWKDSTNWLRPDVDVCQWKGIGCDGTSVSTIELPDNDLAGSPPDTIFTLAQLKTLDLHGNSIDFKFGGIDKATNLEELDIEGTGLTSLQFVGELANTKIKKFKLSSNFLQGTIPLELVEIQQMEELSIAHNKFSGKIPSDIRNLSRLTVLHCYGNKLTGQIPTEIGILTKLQDLVFSENDLTGTLPTQLNKLTDLFALSIHQTTKTKSGIGGKLPAFEALSNLKVLHLDSNALIGAVPEDFLLNTKQKSETVDIGLSDNRLSGILPAVWGDRFDKLNIDLSGNKISGIDIALCSKDDWMSGAVKDYDCDAILCPDGKYNEYGRRSSSSSTCRTCAAAAFWGTTECGVVEMDDRDRLEKFYYTTGGTQWKRRDGWLKEPSYCNGGWFGVYCNDNGEIERISLSDNGLSGTPDPMVFQISTLKELDLESNPVKFSFDGIEAATKLETLYLSDTKITSLVGIGKAKELKTLHLTSNDLEGKIPEELFGLTKLEYLFMNFNRWSGRLSSSIGSLTNLKQLYLLHNRLDGQIPAAIGSLTDLQILALSENNFGGTLPEELNELTSIEILAIQREGGTDGNDVGGESVGTDQGPSTKDGSGIHGPLLAFDNLTKLKELYLGSNSLTGSIPYEFLSGVSAKADPVKVDLISNQLTGTIPAALTKLEELTLYVAGNQISEIADGLCKMNQWMSGEVDDYKCDAILCEPGFFSKFGRQSSDDSKCEKCPDGTVSPFYGGFECTVSEALAERAILKKFYYATDGPNWRLNTNWLDPDSSICIWHGITCVSSNVESLQTLHLNQNSLSGAVPEKLFELSNLQELNLGGNVIDFSFDGIEDAKKLEYINLDSTGLTSLDGIEKAQALTLLHVMSNEFEQFPTNIKNLLNLQVLYISENNFSGELPADLKSLSNLMFLSCYECGLTGTVPTWFGELTELEYIRLDMNSMTGGIPTELLKLSKLEHLDLSEQIIGGAPGLTGGLISFAGLKALSELYLDLNSLTGAIPPTLLQDVDVNEVIKVDLRFNKLTGEIPPEFGTNFDQLSLYLSGNNISSIPADSLCLATSAWNGGNVAQYATTNSPCDGLLCDIGSYNLLGRATDDNPCKVCPRTDAALAYGSTKCGPNEEMNILKELFDATLGLSWEDSEGWFESENICDWYGITCSNRTDRKGFIESIELEDNNLSGDIPVSVFSLTYLTSLRLKRNPVSLDFTGAENANYLETLSLSETNLKSIAGVSKLKSTLKTLHMTSNDINSAIPEELYDLTKLENLFMNYNGLTGSLSTLIGQMTHLQNLYLFHNEITGKIPPSIGQLTDLELLALGENKLSGELPESLENLKKLEILALQREAGGSAPGIGGPLEAKNTNEFGKGLSGKLLPFSGLPKLRELYLGSNSLTGEIPKSFLDGVSPLSETVKVDLTMNELEGSIPSELKRFDDLRLYLAGNEIVEIPSDICNKAQWMNGEVAKTCDAILCSPNTYNKYGRQVDDDNPCMDCAFTSEPSHYGSIACSASDDTLSERAILRLFYQSTGGSGWEDAANWMEDSESICDWHGVHCASEDDPQAEETVTELHLPSNKLTGRVPPEVFQLSSMKKLNVRDNAVDFTFAGISAASQLEELFVDSTQIKSLHGVGDATSLKILHLQQNDFGHSVIPDEIYSLNTMKHLFLSDSNFAGPLSTKIGKLSGLKEFYCHGNDLTGEIPTTIGDLSNLESLILSENKFYGTLPTELKKLKKLKSLFVDSFTRNLIGLSGPLLDFAGMEVLTDLYLGSNSFTGSIPTTFLDRTNKGMTITVGLNSNELTGTVPKELSAFSKLNIDLAGNKIEAIEDGICGENDGNDDWMNGGVGKFQCNAILCPIGTFNQHGRQSTDESGCAPCEGTDPSPYMGSLYCASAEKEMEKNILTLFYNSCGGDNWKHKDNWLDDNVDICHWYGISCHEEKGRTVDSILLGSNNVVGTPPKQLFEMVNLKWLWLYSNPLDFKFDGIGNAKKLTSLLLDSTGLTSLEGIGEAMSLVDLDVRFNQLSGPLPIGFENLRNLETLSCADNQFTGLLPAFTTNPKLKSVRMGNNDFAGSVPSFSIHSQMKSLDLSGNRLSGNIPPTLLESADTSAPIFIDLSSNQITGGVPTELERFSKLTLLLRDNMILGIDPKLCDKELWNDGDVGDFGCDAILCQKDMYAPNGRASREGSQCMPCDSADYYGTTVCLSAQADSHATILDSGRISFILVAFALVAQEMFQ